jgi:hypothetical protein
VAFAGRLGRGARDRAEIAEGENVSRAAVVALGASLGVYPVTMAAGHPVVWFFGAATVACAVVTAAIRAGLAYATCVCASVAYVLALNLGDVDIDLFAPAVGLGSFLLIEAAVSVGGTGSRVQRAVALQRASFLLTVVAAGVMVAVGVVWAGGAARVTGPGALLLASLAGLGVLGWVVKLAAEALDRNRGAGG